MRRLNLPLRVDGGGDDNNADDGGNRGGRDYIRKGGTAMKKGNRRTNTIMSTLKILLYSLSRAIAHPRTPIIYRSSEEE